MTNKLKVYCDLDQTLCPLVENILPGINKEYSTDITLEDATTCYPWMQEQIHQDISKHWNRKGLYDSMPLYPGANTFVDCLNEWYDLKIISHCHESMKEEKREYIKKTFDLLDDQILCVSEGKHNFMEPGSVIIDDYLLNLQSHIYYNNGFGILFNYKNKIGWANYSEKGSKTERHFFANSYSNVLYLLHRIKIGE